MEITYSPERGRPIAFNVPDASTLGEIMKAFAKIPGVPYRGVRIYLDGQQVHLADTAEKVIAPDTKVFLRQDQLLATWMRRP